MKGRVALGLDNMSSGITVPSKNDPTVQIQPNAGSANRVTAIEADSLGLGAGTEQVAIGVTNLPEHEHTMQGSAENQYYAYRTATGVPEDQNAISGPGTATANLGQYLSTSGGVKSDTAINQPISIMNPYLALNYIIYTGN
jgi:microcystin-dependent protein